MNLETVPKEWINILVRPSYSITIRDQVWTHIPIQTPTT